MVNPTPSFRITSQCTVHIFLRNLPSGRSKGHYFCFLQKLGAETQKEQKGTILAERGHFCRKNPFLFCQFLQKESISAESPLFRSLSVLSVTFGFRQKLTLTNQLFLFRRKLTLANQLFLFRQKHFRSTTKFTPLFFVVDSSCSFNVFLGGNVTRRRLLRTWRTDSAATRPPMPQWAWRGT